jgi:hypothetical protein
MDLVEWLQSQGAKVRKGGQEYCVNCPKCGDTKKHLYVNPEIGVAHCFRCGYSGRVEEVLVDGFGLSFDEVRGLLSSFRKADSKVVSPEEKAEVSFPEGSVELLKVGRGVERLLLEWCKESGVKYEDLVEMKCRWWEGRLVIPCWKDGGRRELWYWVARAVKDIEPKYINCAAPKGEVIWGIDWYDISDGYLYVCEGWKDGYRMKGIALLGKEITSEQVKIISRLAEGRKIRVLLDRDAWNEGVVVGMKIGRGLGYSNVEVGFLVGLKDPGEGKSKEEVLKSAVFVGMEGGIGEVIELIRRLRIELVSDRWSRLRV